MNALLVTLVVVGSKGSWMDCAVFFCFFFAFLDFAVSLRWWMAMSTAPVAPSPQVAYSLLPSMIHDSKKRGNLWFHHLPSCTFKRHPRAIWRNWIDAEMANIWLGDGNYQKQGCRKLKMGTWQIMTICTRAQNEFCNAPSHPPFPRQDGLMDFYQTAQIWCWRLHSWFGKSLLRGILMDLEWTSKGSISLGRIFTASFHLNQLIVPYNLTRVPFPRNAGFPVIARVSRSSPGNPQRPGTRSWSVCISYVPMVPMMHRRPSLFLCFLFP